MVIKFNNLMFQIGTSSCFRMGKLNLAFLKNVKSDSDKLGLISNSLSSFLYKNTYLIHEV